MLQVCTLRVVLFDLAVARDKVIAARARHDRGPPLAGSMLRVCTLREQEVVLFDLEFARDKVIAARTRHDRGPLRVVRHRAITCAGQGAG